MMINRKIELKRREMFVSKKFISVYTDKVPQPIGPYSQGVFVSGNGLLFLSGQIPVNPVTGDVVSEDIVVQTEQVFQNLQAVLGAKGMDFSHVVKTSVFLQDMQDFVKMNQVYAKYFREPFPARSCVAVKALPKGVRVEIELTAVKE